MFGIKPIEGIDIDLFNKKYNENKNIIDILIDEDMNEKNIEKKISSLGYDEIFELFEFLQMCDNNYTVVNLLMPITLYLHQKEDDMFLDLYMAQQTGNIEKYLSERSLSELRVIKRCFENDGNSFLIFPDLYQEIVEKEKSYHI